MINIAKNVDGESVNKLTPPKLIAYNDKMPTNNMIKSKSPNTYASESATLTSKSLTKSVIDLSRSFNKNQTNITTIRKIKQRHTETMKSQENTKENTWYM